MQQVLLNTSINPLRGAWYLEKLFSFIWYWAYDLYSTALLKGWPLPAVMVVGTLNQYSDEVWDSQPHREIVLSGQEIYVLLICSFFKRLNDNDGPNCKLPWMSGIVQGSDGLPYELPMILAYLSPFCKFHANPSHYWAVISQSFELYVELWSRLMSSAYTEVDLAHGLACLMIPTHRTRMTSNDQRYSMSLGHQVCDHLLTSTFLEWSRESSSLKKTQEQDVVAILTLQTFSDSGNVSRRGTSSLLLVTIILQVLPFEMEREAANASIFMFATH